MDGMMSIRHVEIPPTGRCRLADPDVTIAERRGIQRADGSCGSPDPGCLFCFPFTVGIVRVSGEKIGDSGERQEEMLGHLFRLPAPFATVQ